MPKDPVDGWKESLLETGRYGDKKVDYLLEGEGTSAYAAQLQGLTSCRARVELRLIPVPGRSIATSDRGVAAGRGPGRGPGRQGRPGRGRPAGLRRRRAPLGCRDEEAVTVRGTGPVP